MAARTRKGRTAAAPAEPTVERVELPEPKHRYVVFAEWLATNKGYADLDPATLQVALANYGAFQRSDVNRSLNAERKAERESAAAERSTRATRTTKTTKATTAATESKPTVKRTTKRAASTTAAKPAGKTTGRRGRKAAAATTDAPY